MPDTTIFFTTDLHGSDKCFNKFLNAATFYKADVLVLGGDITGKTITPIISQSDGSYKARFLGQEYTLHSQEQIKSLEQKIADTGSYAFCTDQDHVRELDANPKALDDLFSRLMIERVQQWLAVAEKRLAKANVACYISPGNDDRFEIDAALNSSTYVINPEARVVDIDRYHEMVTLGFSNITPWKCPRDISDEELGIKIQDLATKVRNMERCVFNFHCPPFDTGLDIAPKLDRNFKPVTVAGQMVSEPVGSRSVRSAIERFQPCLGLHGHIHESKASFRLGKTLCLNPGSEYAEGILRGVIVKLNEKGVRGHLFVSG